MQREYSLMNLLRTEGVILQATPFREADQILTVIGPEGLLKMMYKGALSRKRGGGSQTMPLQKAEFIYSVSKGNSDLASCREISILHTFLGLRQKLAYLESAGEMVAAILKSQHGNIPAPLLYKLFVMYLEKIPDAHDPYILPTSFKLKIMNHEGILALMLRCSHCKQTLNTLNIYEGECYCNHHAPIAAQHFNEAETDMLLLCTYGRSINHLIELTGSLSFLKKVNHLFQTQP